MTSRRSIAASTAQADAERHQLAIEQVDRDNQKLKVELALENKQDNVVNNSSAAMDIKRLQDQGDAYTRKIELERRRIVELDKQIAAVQNKVNQQRKKMGGVNVSKENNLVLTKQIRVIENRLDKSIVRYNQILGKNTILKEKIDDLRKERIIFDGIYKKLEKEMHTEKREMAKLVNECNKAYKERDRAKEEIANLKTQADEEQQAFQAEWKALGEMIERDKKVRDAAGQQKESKSAKIGDMTATEEDELKNKIAKGRWNIAKDKASIASAKEKSQNYDEMFEKIMQETGVTDIEELVQRFIDSEDKNFKLYTKANSLEAEIKLLEEQSARVEAEVEKYRCQGAKQDTQRKRVLYEMEQRLESTTARADSYEQKYVSAQKVLQLLKSGVQTMYDQLERAGPNRPQKAAFFRDGVSEENISQYLGVVELRAKEILQAFKVTNKGDSEAMQRVLGAPPTDAVVGDPVEKLAKIDGKGTKCDPKAVLDPIDKLAAVTKEEAHLNDGLDAPIPVDKIQKSVSAKAEELMVENDL